MKALKEEIRHQLVMLPYFSVFDWLQAEAPPDGTVILTGQVVRPALKSDAEARVKRLEGATQVINGRRKGLENSFLHCQRFRTTSSEYPKEAA
jgi:hypothetical protein